MALSERKSGEMGGAYDGQDVVWVGKAEDNNFEDDSPYQGAEWPAQHLRLAKGDKPTFNEMPEDVEGEEATYSIRVRADGLFESMALFYRRDQMRNWKGMWVDEGRGQRQPVAQPMRPDEIRNYHDRWAERAAQRGNLRSARPMGEVAEDAIRGETERQKETTVRKVMEKMKVATEAEARAGIKRNLRNIYSTMTPEEQKAFGTWYYEVHDMAWEWAQDLDVRPEIVAGVIASLSPQTLWVGRNDKSSPGWQNLYADVPTVDESAMYQPNEWAGNEAENAMNSNQMLAWKVLRVVYQEADTEITITQGFVDRINTILGESQHINYASYDGADQGVHGKANWQDKGEYDGKNFIGTFKYSELPADILTQVLGAEWRVKKVPRLDANGNKQYNKAGKVITDDVEFYTGGTNELKGVMQDMGLTAINLARGAHPDAPRPNQSNPNRTLLDGPKTRSFYNNIINPDDSMDSTWDVHMQRIGMNLKKDELSTEEGAQIIGSRGGYQWFHDIMAETAAELGIKPHELQAATWVQWRRLRGREETAHGRLLTQVLCTP